MQLVGSYDDFRNDVIAAASSVRRFDLPPFAVADLAGFLALRETRPSPTLQSLADLCVAWPDHHRQSPTPAELQRRRGNGLTSDAELLLLRWGYPSVFARWRFHMTLTHQLPTNVQLAWKDAAERHFSTALNHSRRLESICLFTQMAPGAPFLLAERIPLA